MEVIAYGLFAAFAVRHLVDYSVPLRLAGWLSVVGLFWAHWLRPHPLVRQTATVLLNWSVIVTGALWFAPHARNWHEFMNTESGLGPWSVAAMASASILLWTGIDWRKDWRIEEQAERTSEAVRKDNGVPTWMVDMAAAHRLGLQLVAAGALASTLWQAALVPAAAGLSAAAFSLWIAAELWTACRDRVERRVWNAEGLALLAWMYFAWFGVIRFADATPMFALLGMGLVMHVAGVAAGRRESTAVLAGPFLTTGFWLPLAAVGAGVIRHVGFADRAPWLGMNSLAIFLAGGYYFWQAIEHRHKHFAVLSALIVNVALALLWRELRLDDPQFYMIPVGVTVLTLVQILRREIPTAWHDPLRYAGALTILVSPTFHIVGGSWLHLFTLMVASTAVLLASIGLRVRPLMYAGAAFLLADLVGMVVIGGIDRPAVLWVAGICFGAAVIVLAAWCEHNREKLQQRLRMLAAQLNQWE
jgi:hypothetical protein